MDNAAWVAKMIICIAQRKKGRIIKKKRLRRVKRAPAPIPLVCNITRQIQQINEVHTPTDGFPSQNNMQSSQEIQLQSAECHICMTAQGLFGYKPHDNCSYTEKLCKQCAVTLINQKHTCPICRSETALCDQIILYDPHAQTRKALVKMCALFNRLYCQMFPIAKPFELTDCRGVRKEPGFDMYPLVSARPRHPKCGVQIWCSQFVLEEDCGGFDLVIQELFMYQDFKREKGPIVGSFRTLGQFVFNSMPLKIRETSKFKHVNRSDLQSMWDILKTDPEANTEPKYWILDTIIEMFDIRDPIMGSVFISDYVFKMLTDIDTFRSATVMHTCGIEEGQIVHKNK